MIHMIWIKKEKNNAVVTDYYLETIAAAFESLGYGVTFTREIRGIHPAQGDTVVVSTAPDVLRAGCKCKNVVFWAQGVWPEESFMRNGSRLRFHITSFIEKQALKQAKFVFSVSDAMREFYEKKYSLNFDGRCYIMPCSNEPFRSQSFLADGKYTENTFCYAGGTSVWQCFEQTVALYRKIEEKYGNTKLLLLVKDREKALECLNKYGVRNFEINFVPVEQLPEVLKTVKFGFVLREPSPVNTVATPTKILTYLANGLIPIYSDCLKGMEGILKNTEFAVPYRNDEDLGQVEKMMARQINPKEVMEEYERIYRTHYDRESHKDRIAALLRKN